MLDAREIEKLGKAMKGQDARLPVVFQALSDERRCKIFRTFLKRPKLCVSDIAKALDMSMSLASQHLKVLETTGLLIREKEGRVVYYRPKTDDPLVRAIIHAVS